MVKPKNLQRFGHVCRGIASAAALGVGEWEGFGRAAGNFADDEKGATVDVCFLPVLLSCRSVTQSLTRGPPCDARQLYRDASLVMYKEREGKERMDQRTNESINQSMNE